MMSMRDYEVDEYGQLVIRHGDLTARISTGRPWRLNTQRVLILMLLKLTRQNQHITEKEQEKRKEKQNRKVDMDLADMREALPWKAKKKGMRDKVRRELKKDLKTIAATTVWREGEAHIPDLRNTPILDSVEWRSGGFTATFSPGFTHHCMCSFVIPFNTRLLKIRTENAKIANCLAIGWKLNVHAYILKNQTAKTSRLLSVEKLLAACPDLPSAEEIRQSGRHWNRRIVEPFQKTLDLLEEQAGLKWHFAAEGGAELTPEEEDKAMFNLRTLSRLYVYFYWYGAPKPEPKKTRKALKAKVLS